MKKILFLILIIGVFFLILFGCMLNQYDSNLSKNNIKTESNTSINLTRSEQDLLPVSGIIQIKSPCQLTWTNPFINSTANIKIIGGGGGGGGGAGANHEGVYIGSTICYYGGGGGGGGAGENLIFSNVTLENNRIYNVAVGFGGAGGSGGQDGHSGSNGINGTATVFGDFSARFGSFGQRGRCGDPEDEGNGGSGYNKGEDSHLIARGTDDWFEDSWYEEMGGDGGNNGTNGYGAGGNIYEFGTAALQNTGCGGGGGGPAKYNQNGKRGGSGANGLIEINFTGYAYVYRIRNKWTGDYLYIENGQLKYGDYNNPLDQRFQWIFEDFQDNGSIFKRLMNRSNITYVNIEKLLTYIECSESEPGWYSGHWIFQEYNGNIRIMNRMTGKYIHIESLNNGIVELGYINAGCTSSQWIIEPVNLYEIYRIRNRQSGRYLYSSNSYLYCDIISLTDARSHWIFKNIDNGVTRIENVNTKNYCHIENLLNQVQCTNAPYGWVSSYWLIQNYDGYSRIKNKWRDYYLHNQTGGVIAGYGDVLDSDQSSHWIFELVQ